MVSHPKTPILNCLYYLLWLYFLTVSEFSCLAKSQYVSGLTPLPHIPNQLHFMQECGCLPVARMCAAIARGYVIVDLFVHECLLFFGMLFICTGMLFDRKHARS